MSHRHFDILTIREDPALVSIVSPTEVSSRITHYPWLQTFKQSFWWLFALASGLKPNAKSSLLYEGNISYFVPIRELKRFPIIFVLQKSYLKTLLSFMLTLPSSKNIHSKYLIIIQVLFILQMLLPKLDSIKYFLINFIIGFGRKSINSVFMKFLPSIFSLQKNTTN